MAHMSSSKIPVTAASQDPEDLSQQGHKPNPSNLNSACPCLHIHIYIYMIYGLNSLKEITEGVVYIYL